MSSSTVASLCNSPNVCSKTDWSVKLNITDQKNSAIKDKMTAVTSAPLTLSSSTELLLSMLWKEDYQTWKVIRFKHLCIFPLPQEIVDAVRTHVLNHTEDDQLRTTIADILEHDLPRLDVNFKTRKAYVRAPVSDVSVFESGGNVDGEGIYFRRGYYHYTDWPSRWPTTDSRNGRTLHHYWSGHETNTDRDNELNKRITAAFTFDLHSRCCVYPGGDYELHSRQFLQAASKGNVTELQRLLRVASTMQGILFQGNKNGLTPLHMAAQGHHLDAMR